MDPAVDPAQSLGRPAPASPDSGGPAAEASAQTESETDSIDSCETRQASPAELTRMFATLQGAIELCITVYTAVLLE